VRELRVYVITLDKYTIFIALDQCYECINAWYHKPYDPIIYFMERTHNSYLTYT